MWRTDTIINSCQSYFIKEKGGGCREMCLSQVFGVLCLTDWMMAIKDLWRRPFWSDSLFKESYSFNCEVRDGDECGRRHKSISCNLFWKKQDWCLSWTLIFIFRKFWRKAFFFCEFDRKIVNFARVFQLWMNNIDVSHESFIKGVTTWNVKQFILKMNESCTARSWA